MTPQSSLCGGTDNARGVPEPGAFPWYAIRCAPNRERSIRDALGLRGLESFLPAYSETVRWSDRLKVVERLLFPGYLFVRVPPGDFAEVLAVAGVLGVLPSNLRPLPVSDIEISNVERVISSCLPVQPFTTSFAAGELVTVACGPLKGASGVVVRDGAKARLVVKVEMLGRAVSVEISPADLAKSACQ